jgi:hypothetical protein
MLLSPQMFATVPCLSGFKKTDIDDVASRMIIPDFMKICQLV